MSSRLFVFVLLASLSALLLFSQRHVESMKTAATGTEPQSVRAAAFAVSASVSSIARGPIFQRPKNISEIPLKEVNDPNEEQTRLEKDGTLHDSDGSIANLTGEPMPTPSLNFEGIANLDNADQYNLLFIPPDTTGDVGPNNYVQAVNSLIRVYDKSGNALTPAFKLSSLLAPLGTPCSTRNDGDPTVVYDPLADRWLITEFCTAFPPFRQMIAVSVTSDPTGQYFVYEFVMPNVRLNDYPKLAAWTDGYYMSTDEFLGSDYVGSGAFSFDRAKMLAGDATATYIYFHLPQPPPARIGGILPADLDGLRPPPDSAPNVFAGYAATEYGDPYDAIRLFEFHADFRNPDNSTFRERPESPIAVAAFDPTSPDGRTDIAQPAPGEWLDSISDRLMYRIAYRNFGDHESLVFNQTVRLSSISEAYRSGVRVYELQRRGGSPFAPVTQSTITQSTASRWLGSAAQDNQGNLAVAYSLASDQDRPAIMYTGKLATDPPDTFRSETKAITGTGVQKAFGFRWGDYSGMSVDPADDCTFWITNEYFTQESEDISDFAWLTRISAFKFPECTPAASSKIIGTVTDARTGAPVAAASVKAAVYSRMTGGDGSYGSLVVIPGSYSIIASAAGYRSQSMNITVGNAQTIQQDFSLEPIPIITENSATISAESCSPDHAPEPSETVSIDLSLRNTGRLSANDLVVTLEQSGGVVRPSQPQHFGPLSVDGPPVSRSFSFTVSPNLSCGAELALSFSLSDGSTSLGTLVVSLHAGATRYALKESFDLSRTRLPEGWTSVATGAQRPWLVSNARSSSPFGAVFSPDPNQIGLNELISPPIQISSREAHLNFRNWYEFETTFLRNRLYDGSVLEISSDGGPWQDVLSAGARFDSGGYDGVIDSCCQNPLAGHPGWSGRSGPNQTSEFINTSVRLPSNVAGHSVRFRWRVGTDIGTFREGQYIDDVEVTDGYACACASAVHGGPMFDFDGDGRTDYSIYRPNDNADAPDFVVENSSSTTLVSTPWGSAGDIAANADFDGDGRTDYAVFRPSTGAWFILRSSDSSSTILNFGLAGDKPTPFDFDGDGKADISVYRPSTGVWYSINSSNGAINARQFGLPGDKAIVGDYDGDGKSDITVFRPSTGVWYAVRSSDSSVITLPFGQLGDLPVSGDYDGDGETDITVFRPSEGVWYLLRSELGFGAVRFGQVGDMPLQADFDGDGQSDIAVYRASTAVWYVIKSSDLSTMSRRFGNLGDQAVPAQNVGE